MNGRTDERVRPDFLCIGAARAGTTWLYENLRRHPTIWLPPVKEIRYFTDGNPRRVSPIVLLRRTRFRARLRNRLRSRIGTRSLSGFGWELQYFFSRRPRDDAWYQALFRPAGNRIAGDITPGYARLSRGTVERIHRMLPDARVIFIMRNPIERAWSEAQKELGEWTGRSLQSAPIEQFLRYLASPRAHGNGDYLRTLRNWQPYRASGRFHYCFYDDLESRPAEFLRGICGFLGIDPREANFAETMARRVNARQSPESEIPEPVRRYLHELYRPAVAELSACLGRSFDHWDMNQGDGGVRGLSSSP